MPRAKKAAVEVLPPEEASKADDAKPITPAPVAEEKHRVIRTWTKRVPVDELPEDEIDDDTEDGEDGYTDDDEPAIVFPAPTDPMELLLSEMEASAATWNFAVYRLKNYEKDQSMNVKARTSVGMIHIPNTDYVNNREFEDELRSARFCRPGFTHYFMLQFRRNGIIRGFYKENPIAVEVSAEELARKAAENPTAQPLPQFNFVTPGAPQADSFDNFVKTASKLQSIGILPNFAQLANGQQAPARAPEMTEELALMKIINSEDALKSRLFDGLRKLMGAPEPERGWVELVALGLEHGPAIIREIGAILRTPPAGAPGAAMQTPPGMMQPPPFPMQQNGAAMQPPPPPPTGPDAMLLAFLIQSLALRSPVSGVAITVEQQIEETPELGPLVDSMLNAPAQEVLDWLARIAPAAEPVANEPGAADWIAGLQGALTKDETEQVQ